MTSSLVDVAGRARILNPRRAIVAVAVLAILVFTLAPSGHRPSEPFSFCVACGPRGLADGILNFWLFLPLGIALGWNGQRPRAAIVFGFALSAAIELTQTIVPGRDPSLSDVVFNTAGTAVGILVARRPQLWLAPDKAISRLLAVISMVSLAAVLLASVLLLSPADSASFVARSGEDLVLRYKTRASELGLDEPEYRVRGVMHAPSGEDSALSARRHHARWQIDIGGGATVTLGPTVGQGWALLAYPDALGRRWGRVLNALWLFALCLPIGFFARGRLLLLAAAVTPVLLALIPALTGVVRTSAEEWAGAAIGLVAGAMLGVLSNRLGQRWHSRQLATAVPG